MTEQTPPDWVLIEAAKLLDSRLNYFVERDTLACDLTKAELLGLARSVAPILLEAGAKMMQDAVVGWLNELITYDNQGYKSEIPTKIAERMQVIEALDPAALAKRGLKIMECDR